MGGRALSVQNARPWVRAALCLALLVAACGGKKPAHAGRDASDVDGSSRVRSVVDPGRPTLRLVHREGDPKGALAVAVFTKGGSRGALLLGELVQHRLKAARAGQPELQVHGIGFVIASEVKNGDEARSFLAALHTALLTPVRKAEVAAAGLGLALQAAAKPLGAPSLIGSCAGEFGAEGAAHIAAPRAPTGVELEDLRQGSARAGRIGLSALGAPALLDTVADAHQAKWPKGGPPTEPWPSEDQIAVRQSGGVLELRVAARVLDQPRAMAAGRALGQADHPLPLRLQSLDRALELGPISVTLRPAGACVALTVFRAGELPASAETLATAALVVEQELLRALGDAPLADPTALALWTPEDAVDAASLAAWTAVITPAPSAATRTLLELLAPETLTLDTARLDALLESTSAALAQRKIPMVSRSESGQPESWLLLGSPCGTGPEPPGEAGLRALSIESATRAFDGHGGVRLEPWIEARSMGIVAHAAPLPDELPEQLGERLARAAVRALVLGAIDGTTIASARAEQLAALGSDPGRDLILRALSGDRPSALDPRGLEREVAALSTLDVDRARQALAREPLRGAYLASLRAAEAASAQAELARLLAPARADVLPCPEGRTPPGAPGFWSVSSVDPEVPSGAFVGAPVVTSAPTGHALEFLLNRPGGYLDHGLLAPGLADAARARYLPGVFGGALIVEVRAPAAELDRAVAQTRGLLASLAAGVPAADARLAREEEMALRALTERSPRGRLVELWLGRLPPPPVEADLRTLAAQLSEPKHRVVRVDVRAQ